MSEIDDIDGGEGGAPEPSGPPGGAPAGAMEAAALAGGLCLACGGTVNGPYCSHCGQKNDDLRRNSFLLAKDFMRDTFGFDSRMWRTLGLLAISPGSVPKDYAHGRRSRFTPPVRLFLVVSFLFFLTIGLTNTLFVGLEIDFRKTDPAQLEKAAAAAQEAGVALDPNQSSDCSFQGRLRFFVKEKDLDTDKERLDACLGGVKDAAHREIETSENVVLGEDEGLAREREQAAEFIDRIFTGISWTVTNPRAFNDSFNDWLPRVLFLMTPVLALILALFLRRDALLFDHLIMSFYTHAVSFAVIGVSLILAQLGAPYMGLAAMLAIAVYYVAVLKRGYGRGWVKTIWTALMSGALYLFIFFTVLMTIVSNIVWRAAA